MGAQHPRGEVAFDHDGERLVLRLTTNEICDLEDRLDCSIQDIANRLSDIKTVRISLMRTVFAAGLSRCTGSFDEPFAGEVMTAIGAEQAGILIGQAFEAAFPPAKTTKGGGGDAAQNPKMATGRPTGRRT